MADKFSVLFVDDEEYNLIAFRATFRKDYTIFTAKSGKEALKILRNENIGLIITDQRMPEMTGVELLEHIYLSGTAPCKVVGVIIFLKLLSKLYFNA